MIFVTVGTELPFDRLTMAVDAVCARYGLADVFMQIGERGQEPRFGKYARFLPFTEMQARMRDAALVIAHAGPGSVSLARANGKKPLILPRRPELREVIDGHQLVLADRLAAMGAAHIVRSEAELGDVIPQMLQTGAGAVQDSNLVNHAAAAAVKLDALCMRVVAARRPR